MAEKKGVGHAYNVDFLNVVFAASSLFLFLSVVWMVWDDYSREWKNTQRKFVDLQIQVTRAQFQAATRAIDRNKYQQLVAQERAAQQSIAANQKQVDAIQAKLDAIKVRLYRANSDYQTAKATYDQDKYAFEAARANKLAGANQAQAVTVLEKQ